MEPGASDSSLVFTGDLAAGVAQECITEGWKHPRAGRTMPKFTVHDDLQATAFVVTQRGAAVFALVSLDMGTILKTPSDEIREIVAAKTGILFERILLHSTHSHATWAGRDVDPEWLADRIAAAIARAVATAKPAAASHAHVELGPGFTFNRRIRLTGGLGAHCVMFNTDCRTVGGRVEASAQLAKAVSDWDGNWTDFDMSLAENWCDGPVDSHLHVLRFIGSDRRALGTIVRFTGHPVIVSRAWIGNTLSRDAVGYIADYLRDGSKVPCLYLTGLSGSQRLYCEEYTHDEAKRRGTLIARQAYAAKASTGPQPLERFAFASAEIELDLWEGFPKDLDEQARKLAAVAADVKAAVAAKRPSREFKRLAEAHQRMEFAARMIAENVLSPGDPARGKTTQPVAVFDLGPVAFAGFPCEPFHQVNEALRQKFGDRVITAELVNGSHGYVPTAEEFALGGYESTWCTTAPDAAKKYVAAAAELIRSSRKSKE